MNDQTNDLHLALGKFLTMFGDLEFQVSDTLNSLINIQDEAIGAIVQRFAIFSISKKVLLISILFPYFIKGNQIQIEKYINQKIETENEFPLIKKWAEKTQNLINFRNKLFHSSWVKEETKIFENLTNKEGYQIRLREIPLSEIEANTNETLEAMTKLFSFSDRYLSFISPVGKVIRDGKVFNIDSVERSMAISNYDASPDLINYWIDNIKEAPKDFVDYYNDLIEYVNKHTDTYD